MERRVITFFTVILAILSMGLGAVLLFVPDIHQIALAYSMREQVEEENIRDLVINGEDIYEFEKSPYNLRLEFPTNVKATDIETEINYHEKWLKISVRGIGKTYYNDFPIIGKKEGIDEITYYSQDNVGYMYFGFDRIYDYEYEIQGRYLLVDLYRPKEKYDYVVVLDAGHGGKESGAAENGHLEKELNLDIILKLNDIFKENNENIKTYLTRSDDSFMGVEKRSEFSDSVDADLFVSVHQNSTGSGRTSDVNGTEILYRYSDETGISSTLALNLLNSICDELGSENRGIVPGEDIYVLRHTKAPAALVELGFMTNPQELEKLADEDYRQKAAQAIYEAIIETLDMD